MVNTVHEIGESMIKLYAASHSDNDLKSIQEIAINSYRFNFTKLYDDPEDLNRYLKHEYEYSALSKSILTAHTNWYFAELSNREKIGIIKISEQALLNLSHSPDDSLFIEKIYISPNYTGQGHGAEILLQLENLAIKKNKKYMWLEVLSLNVQAIHFYQKHGFNIYTEDTLQIYSQTFKLLRMFKKINL